MDEGFAIEVIGKREAYETEAERVMSIVAGADIMPSSMTVSRDRGGLLHRLEAEDIMPNDIGRIIKGGDWHA